jgi:O-antigen/teichoic acid export membrane protein
MPNSETALGIYSIAALLATVLTLFPATFSGIFFPLASKLLGKGDIEGMRSVVATSQRWVLFLTLPIALVFIGFAEELLALFYGVVYIAGKEVVILFVIGIAINSFAQTASLLLAAARQVKLELYAIAVAAIINLILNIALIPSYGINGAAAASGFSLIVMGALWLYYTKKLFNISLPSESFRLAGVAVITLLILIIIKPFISPIWTIAQLIPIDQNLQIYVNKIAQLLSLSLLSLLCFAIFFPIALWLKCFQREDVLLMKSALRRAYVPASVSSLLETIVMNGVA